MNENVISNLLKYIKETTGNSKLIESILKLKDKKVNIMIIGGTGVGKSSTINALFGEKIAKVGDNPAPETMEITQFNLDSNITLWDSPGLGDGVKDNEHKEKIISLLKKKDNESNMLIDCVLVILSANNKDLGTEYELINNILIPNIEEPEKRVIIAINKADEALSSIYWNRQENKPSLEQKKFLEDKLQDIKSRIYESTNIDIKNPLYYSAGYSDENFSEPPYNIDNLMIYILESVPPSKVANTVETFGENITKEVIKTGVEIIKDVINLGTGIIKGFLKALFGK